MCSVVPLISVNVDSVRSAPAEEWGVEKQGLDINLETSKILEHGARSLQNTDN
jgi:hypothetical protein